MQCYALHDQSLATTLTLFPLLILFQSLQLPCCFLNIFLIHDICKCWIIPQTFIPISHYLFRHLFKGCYSEIPPLTWPGLFLPVTHTIALHSPSYPLILCYLWFDYSLFFHWNGIFSALLTAESPTPRRIEGTQNGLGKCLLNVKEIK